MTTTTTDHENLRRGAKVQISDGTIVVVLGPMSPSVSLYTGRIVTFGHDEQDALFTALTGMEGVFHTQNLISGKLLEDTDEDDQPTSGSMLPTDQHS